MTGAESSSKRRYSLGAYARLREDGAYISELVRGELVREPRPGSLHARVQAELARVLGNHVRERDAGRVYTDVGVVLAESPPTVRGPDVAFVAAARLEEDDAGGFLRVAPDLACEIVSPSNTNAEIQRRVLEYLEAGVRLVWTIDPLAGTALVYRSREEVRLLTAEDALDGVDVLPGFRLRRSDLLA